MGDMDAFDHVNNTVYYRYIENARIAYFDKLNIFAENILTVVASSQCRYLSSVLYPDQLKIGAKVEELRNSAIRMHYTLWSETQQKTVAQGECVIVCLDKINMQKTLIPQIIRNKIQMLEKDAGNEILI